MPEDQYKKYEVVPSPECRSKDALLDTLVGITEKVSKLELSAEFLTVAWVPRKVGDKGMSVADNNMVVVTCTPECAAAIKNSLPDRVFGMKPIA
jgi:hypothetical protein